MSFLDYESSVESSRPREGLKITHGTTTYLIATGTRPVTIDGEVYEPLPAARGEIKAPDASGNDSPNLTIHLPVSHPLAQRYLAVAGPPHLISVELRRLQLTGAVFEWQWRGEITAMQIDGHVAIFTVASRLVRALLRMVSTYSASRVCGHVLYDSNCRVDRDSFKVTTTVASYNGRIVTVASWSNGNQWAQFGELVHVPSGERMTVADQVGTQLTLQAPIHGLRLGDAVEVYAGCNHQITTAHGCQQKFSNQVNFGGMNQLPKRNPFVSLALGVLS